MPLNSFIVRWHGTEIDIIMMNDRRKKVILFLLWRKLTDDALRRIILKVDNFNFPFFFFGACSK